MIAGVTILQVAEIVATGYGRTVAEICADLRDKDLQRARHVTFWLARSVCGAERGVIARTLGNRDPNTVAIGLTAIDKARAIDPVLALELEAYRVTIERLAEAKLLENFEGFDGHALARMIRMSPRAASRVSERDIKLMAQHVLRIHDTLQRAAALVRLLASQACRDEALIASAAGFLAIDLEALGVIQPEKEKTNAA